MVSYAERHNEANGEDNNDGHAENYSANWGVEGPTDDPAILDTRAPRAARAARHACSSRRARRCCWAATSSAAPSAATTTPIARTTRSPGSTGRRPQAPRAGAHRLRRAAHRAAPPPRGAALAAFLHGQARAGAGHLRHRLVRRARARPVSQRFLEQSGGAAPCACAAPAATATATVSILTAFFNADRRGSQSSACRRRGLPTRLLLDSAAARRRPSAISTARRSWSRRAAPC